MQVIIILITSDHKNHAVCQMKHNICVRWAHSANNEEETAAIPVSSRVEQVNLHLHNTIWLFCHALQYDSGKLFYGISKNCLVYEIQRIVRSKLIISENYRSWNFVILKLRDKVWCSYWCQYVLLLFWRRTPDTRLQVRN